MNSLAWQEYQVSEWLSGARRVGSKKGRREDLEGDKAIE